MRNKLLILIFLPISFTCCQSQTDSTKNGDKTIINELSEKHINIPGTKVSLIPPKSFQISNQFVGLQNPTGEFGINIMDMPGGDFSSNTRNFTVENFKSRGVKVNDFYKLSINGFQAIFAEIEGAPMIKNYSLVFGDSSFSTMINGIAPKYNDEISNEIKTSMLSVVYNKEKIMDGSDVASFSIDTKTSIFKHRQYAAGMYVFSSNAPEVPLEENGGSMIMLLQLPVDVEKLSNMKELAFDMLTGLKEKGMENIQIIEKSEIEIDNSDAYEIVLTAKNPESANNVLIYLVSLGNLNNMYIINGMSYDFDNQKNMIKEFRKTVKTFKYKE
jgi:hypothetical protein